MKGKDNPHEGRFLAIPPELDPAEARVFAVRSALALIAGAMHAVQLVIFFFMGLALQAWLSIGSVLIFAAAYMLVRRGHGTLAMWIGYAEVVVHATYLTVMLGAATGYGLFMFCLGPFIFLAMRPSQTGHRYIGIAIALIGGIALWVWGWDRQPWIALDPAVTRALFIMNASGVLLALVLVVAWFSKLAADAQAAVAAERERSEALLNNILPARIAERLKDGEKTIADDVGSVSVLFADLVGFTKLSSTLPPRELISMLDAVFSGFDALAEAHGLEKIKTIGDAYMVVGGLGDNDEDHAGPVASMALGMREFLRIYSAEGGDQRALDIRIGIHSGPVIAGVIGVRKFAYDLWGDTVNTASRMESHGEPGQIQVSTETRALLGENFRLEQRATIEVKGKGAMQTFWLHGEP